MASQTSPDEMPQAPNEHPTTHPPNDEPESDNDDTSTVYFDANSRPSSPSHEYTLAYLKEEFAKVHKERMEIMNRLFSLKRPPPPEPFEKRLESLEVSFMIVTVINYIGSSNYNTARREVQKALKRAHEIGDVFLVARCFYWMGRIEFELNNLAAAYVCFKTARPCVMDEVYPEGASVEFYLGLSRSGISEEYRKRALREHNRAIIEAWGEQHPADRRAVGKSNSKKRKRDRTSWDLVLRPAPDQSRQGQSGQRAGKATVWTVHDTEDLQHYRRVPVEPTVKASDSNGMEWLTAKQSHPPLEGRRFTFRCYLQDISPRTRPTNIFPPQPCEVILTDQQSKYMQEWAKDNPVSIFNLARERENYENMKRAREAEAQEAGRRLWDREQVGQL